MKPNIDLTEDRAFAKDSFIIDFFSKIKLTKFKWGFEKEFNLNKNKTLRSPFLRCDRCGKKHNFLFAKLEEYNLCENCETLIKDSSVLKINKFTKKREEKKIDLKSFMRYMKIDQSKFVDIKLNEKDFISNSFPIESVLINTQIIQILDEDSNDIESEELDF